MVYILARVLHFHLDLSFHSLNPFPSSADYIRLPHFLYLVLSSYHPNLRLSLVLSMVEWLIILSV